MASENEIKYVLRGYATLEKMFASVGWQDIEQGYLNPNARVRCIIHDNGDRQHFFAYKQRLPNGHNLEFEPEIPMEDFATAWPHTNERLTKRRVPIIHNDLLWDIDFYRWQHGQYFVLAEVEMPETMLRPPAILPTLEPYLVYEVPRDDHRFAARRLADETHVQALARELGLLT